MTPRHWFRRRTTHLRTTRFRTTRFRRPGRAVHHPGAAGPGTASYRSALRTPGAAAFFLAAAPARVGVAMAGLGIVWLVHAETGSFAAAGLVTGSFAVAETLVGPQTARLMDRFGQPRVLVPLLCAHAGAITALVALVLTGAPVPLLMVAGLAAGATVPQIGALSAARWSALLHGRAELAPAFALETMSNDAAFLLGPALAVLTATRLHPAAGTALAGVLVVGAGLVFAALRRTAPAPAARAVRGGRADRGPGRRLWTRNFGTLLAVNVALGVFFGSTQVSVSAFAEVHHAASAAGLLYGLMSTASLLAGLLYGRYHRRTPPGHRLPLILTFLACASLLPMLADSPWQLGLALLLPGAGVAPCVIVASTLVESVMDRSVLTQAFTWTNSACAAGIAVSAAVVGRLVDGTGARTGFAVPLLALTATVALTWSSRIALTSATASTSATATSGR
ncbi:MFS transporter [Streptomyces sp. NPDC088727]|uniref:MFS transporter n=1 Tax=Streptomyces sp. NPDC088727 TaxID=3365875 RepID=UPI0037F5133E